MAIDSITPATSTMDRSCSESESEPDTSGSDGETRPAGEKKKEKPTEPPGVVVSRRLKTFLRETPPEYLKLSLTPSSARATAAYRRRKRLEPEEVSLAEVYAPRDYLSLSLTPSDQPKRRGSRDGSGGGGSSVVSSGAAAGELMVVEAVLPPPPPVQIRAKALPPKKRNVAAAGFYQETAGTSGTSPASSSRCLALAIVNHHDGVSPSSTPPSAGGDGPPENASRPIDAVPLQAVYVSGGVPHQFRLGTGVIATMKDATAPREPAWIREKLGLAAEHQLVFIAGKRVHCSDIDAQQCRFMLPRGEINDRLLPLLTDDERRAANLREAWERPRPQPSGEHGGVRLRVHGKEHGGLVVPVVVNRAGRRMDAELTRWDSSGCTVLKFRNAKGFVSESGLTKDDHIQIWAFRGSGDMHLVIAKTGGGETTAVAPPAAGGQQVA